MPLQLAILQLAAATLAPDAEAESRPTIQLQARVRAKSITVAQQGQAQLEVHAEPGTKRVEVTGQLPPGQRQARNLDVRLDATATIANGAAPREQPPPPSR